MTQRDMWLDHRRRALRFNDGRIIDIPPDVDDVYTWAKNEARAINSASGKEKEINEAEARINRERRRELAEAHAHDDVEDARAALSQAQWMARAAISTFITGALLTGVIPTLDVTIGLTNYFIAPFVIGILLLLLGGGLIIFCFVEDFVGDAKKRLRKEERALRDTLTRPLSNYRTDKPGND